MSSEGILPVGKLKPELLAALLERYHTDDPRVIVGANIGEDAAAIDMGDRYLVAKTDPVTFATDQIGWYAVHVNANDLATRGATPRWFLATILLPQDQATAEQAEEIFRQIHLACRSLGICVVGGHTEVSHDLRRPIVVGQLLGEVEKDRLVTTKGAQVDDDVLLVKGIAIEGTALIARECAATLRARGYPQAVISRLQGYLFDPGISVVREAQLACRTVPVHAMHDPTEGGLAMGLYELAWAAGTGLAVQGERIPVLPECASLCAEFGLDPLGTIASGALVLAVAPTDTPRLLQAYAQAAIPCAVIGRVVPAEAGITLHERGAVRNLPRFDQDEIARLYRGP